MKQGDLSHHCVWMGDWDDLAGQAVSSLWGTLIGGTITILIARWQTLKTIESQGELAASQKAETARLARTERERERTAEAARQLLERLADLYIWLPSLPDVGLEQPVLSCHAREACISAMESMRRSMHTDLFSIGDMQVRERYRKLVKLAYDVGWRGIGREYRHRQIRDVRNYMRYVQCSLEAVIDGTPLPAHVASPVLERSGAEVWLPPELPWHWGDPADGS